jgi:hypothetical protein
MRYPMFVLCLMVNNILNTLDLEHFDTSEIQNRLTRWASWISESRSKSRNTSSMACQSHPHLVSSSKSPREHVLKVLFHGSRSKFARGLAQTSLRLETLKKV